MSQMSHKNYYVPKANRRRTKKKNQKNSITQLIMCAIIVILLIIIFVLLFSIIGDIGERDVPAPTAAPTQYIEPTIAPTSTPEPVNREDVFLKEITSAIKGSIGSDERFTGVTLNGKNVTFTIDISEADTSILPLKYIAESRTGSVTDAFLEITEYDDLWDSVTVDFGNTGAVTLYKNDIEVNEYNMRYFDSFKYVDRFN